MAWQRALRTAGEIRLAGRRDRYASLHAGRAHAFHGSYTQKLNASSSARPAAGSPRPAPHVTAQSYAVRHWGRRKGQRAWLRLVVIWRWGYQTPGHGAVAGTSRANGRRNVAERGQTSRPACASAARIAR